MQSKTSFEPMRSTLSMLSETIISKEIDRLLVKMKCSGDRDYSDAISRIFLLKSIVDSRDHIQAFSDEVKSYSKKKAKQQIEGKPFIFIHDLDDIMERMIEPLNEMAIEKMELMYSEMSIHEIHSFSELCGE